VTSLGAGIFAFLACGAFKSIEEAQNAMCLEFRIFQPNPASVTVYQNLYPLYSKLYFAFGEKHSAAASIGDVMPEIRRIGAEVRNSQ
jgi:L-ribulokinase